MGGANCALGNAANPVAKPNIYCDPEAATIVLGSWHKVTVISWETTMAHAFNKEQIDYLSAALTWRGDFVRHITRHTLCYFESTLGQPTLFVCDTLPVAVTMEPEIVRRAEVHCGGVKLASRLTRN